MKHPLLSLALAAVLLLAAPLANAGIIHLHVNLSGANEVPVNPSLGTGVADFDLDTVLNTLKGHIEFSGLTGFTTAAHIHCCLAFPFQTANVGVATLVPAFPGFPLNVQSGVNDFLLDLNLASSYNMGFISGAPQNGSLTAARDNFIAGLISGRTYLNIHTGPPLGGTTPPGSPGGEIRGFVVAVPEPMTTSLLVLGLAAAGFVSRRRRHN